MASAGRFLLATLVLAVSLLAIEGLASVALVLLEARDRPPQQLAERFTTRYDPEIGWVAMPSLRLQDFYGPGRHFTTDARGFRGGVELEREPPAGARRVVCSGDSFTLGYGVSDADAWPAQLARGAPRLQVANLGQGGWGIDQSFLWYRRVAADLPHDVHLFCVVDVDFQRMLRDAFVDAAKPVLRLEAGRVQVTNVPVPRRERQAGPRGLRNLRSLRLVERLRGRTDLVRPQVLLSEEQGRAVAEAVFAELEELARERGARLALVNLPRSERASPGTLVALEGWKRAACEAAAARGVPFWDLHEDFARVAEADRAALFIAPGEVDFPAASGHYSPRGNALVADALRARLAELLGDG